MANPEDKSLDVIPLSLRAMAHGGFWLLVGLDLLYWRP
jgi:hypothetical protein